MPKKRAPKPTYQTRRERFLSEMEQVVPWQALLEALEPSYYPNAAGRRGRPPIGLERMLRMYFVQQWYGLADEATEEALYDSRALSAFVGLDPACESVPDATTLLKFRRWLEEHALTQTIFKTINARLSEKGLLLRQATLVDATIHCGPLLEEEQGESARCGDALHAQGESMVLRAEGPHRSRCRVGAGAFADGHSGQYRRYHRDLEAVAWARGGGVC